MPNGTTGRIFVANETQFDGYTGGGNKEILDGLMSSGDVGHFDANGLLFVDGRDDDMIVSGGENVFPREVDSSDRYLRRLSRQRAEKISHWLLEADLNLKGNSRLAPRLELEQLLFLLSGKP